MAAVAAGQVQHRDREPLPVAVCHAHHGDVLDAGVAVVEVRVVGGVAIGPVAVVDGVGIGIPEAVVIRVRVPGELGAVGGVVVRVGVLGVGTGVVGVRGGVVAPGGGRTVVTGERGVDTAGGSFRGRVLAGRGDAAADGEGERDEGKADRTGHDWLLGGR